MKSDRNIRGAVYTLAGGICWGLSGSMGQYLFQHEHMDSRWLVPIRLGLAGIILLLFTAVRKGVPYIFRPWAEKRDRRDLIVYGLLGVSFCQFFYFTTIQLSTAGAATILQDLSPVMILLVGCISAKRPPKASEILAVILALAGVFLISTHGSFSHMNLPLPALITGILSAVCVTIYNVTPTRLMNRYPVILMQGWAFVMGSVCFLLVFRPWRFHYVPTSMGYLGIAFVVVVGNILAFPLYIEGIHLIGPEKGILYGFSEPVTAAIVSALLLNTAFTFWDLVGFVCVFAMLILISAGQKNAAQSS